jgi:hypothetical protein
MTKLQEAIAANAAKPIDEALAADPRVTAIRQELEYAQTLAKASMRYTSLKLEEVQRIMEKLIALCKAIKAETSK